MRSRHLSVGWSILCLSLIACGGGKPAESADSAEPAADTEKEEAAKEEPKQEESAEAEKSEPKAEEKSSESESSGPTSNRTPKDIVTAPDVIFMLSFNDSDPKKVAEEKCEKSSKGDAKKNADCMANARKQFDHDGFRFKEGGGGWQWLTIKRNGKKLVNLHKVPIEFGAETKNTITIKVTGKDTGTKPTRFPGEVTFEVPNDYQIIRKDPKLGNLVYEAKIGITGE